MLYEVITIPGEFTRKLIRGENPQIAVEADATDPATTGVITSYSIHYTKLYECQYAKSLQQIQ